MRSGKGRIKIHLSFVRSKILGNVRFGEMGNLALEISKYQRSKRGGVHKMDYEGETDLAFARKVKLGKERSAMAR